MELKSIDSSTPARERKEEKTMLLWVERKRKKRKNDVCAENKKEKGEAWRLRGRLN